MADWGDVGLQRAILNSLRSGGGGGFTQTRTYVSHTVVRSSQPQPQITRSSYQPPRQPPPRPVRDIAPTVPRDLTRTVGRRDTLAKEGILPSAQRETSMPLSSSSSSYDMAHHNEHRTSMGSRSHSMGGARAGRRDGAPTSTVRRSTDRIPTTARGGGAVASATRWREIVGGGRLTQGNVSGNVTLETSGGYTSEVGQYMYDLTTAHVAEESATTVSFTARCTARSGLYVALGLGCFAVTDDEGRWGWVGPVLHYSPSDHSVSVTVDRYLADTTCDVVRKLETLVPRQKAPGARPDSLPVTVSLNYDAGTITCSVGSLKVCTSLVVPQQSTEKDRDSAKRSVVLFASGGKLAVSKWATLGGSKSVDKALDKPEDDGLDPRMVEQIESEILERSPNVQWDDVAGAADAKRLLNEALVLPLLVPEFFTGIRTPWRGVLLFGPPGTGKTLLAKAVATCTNTTFFNISASTLVSRFHGESEKMARTLFKIARKHAPSTIFLDEVDALASKRGEGSEHEASRRLKSELLSQLDGIETGAGSDKRVMVLATTNRPWDLDEAMRRRLEKRIYIPLPDEAGRAALFRLHLKGVTLADDVDFEELARQTDSYSGADINQVCRDAAMAPMRRVVSDSNPAEIAAMKARGDLDQSKMTVTMADLKAGVVNVPSSVAPKELDRYAEWMQEFGSK
eukprot:PhM_4_TR17977/c0_g1_i1/m.20409/K07767/KATNA1; katanin p60 ATPase-containing subunit A1